MIRMIAVDLDDTLLDAHSQITPNTLGTVRRAMDAGALFVLNSGRMHTSVRNFAREIGVNAPIVAFNGAVIYDVYQETVIDESPLQMEVARGICREAEAMGEYVQAFVGDTYYFAETCDKSENYALKSRVQGYPVHKKLSQAIDTDVYKVLLIVDEEHSEEICRALQARFDADAYIIRSSKRLVECVRKGVDKGSGLLRLAARYGIGPDEIMTFGDEQNDIKMLECVSYGYAMQNAAAEVRAKAKFVAPPNTQDGVAQVIEQYLRAGEIAGPKGAFK